MQPEGMGRHGTWSAAKPRSKAASAALPCRSSFNVLGYCCWLF
jgi:hypothetical protein